MIEDDEKKQLAEDMKADAENVYVENGIKTSSRNREDYKYSQSEASFETKKGESANVKISRTVDSINPNNTIVSTTTIENIDGKKNHNSRTSNELEHYNVNSGYRKTTEVYENNTRETSKGEVLTHRTSKVVQSEKGAVGEVVDNSYVSGVNVDNSETVTYINKKGKVTASKTHTFNQNSFSTSRFDSSVNYDNVENVKKIMQTQARNAKDGYVVLVEAINGDKEFGAVLNSKNGETYTRMDGDKAVQVEVDKNGNVSGAKFNANGIKVADLEKKEIKKELKKMRKNADNYIEKVSGSKNIDEYLKTVPFTTQQESTGSLGAVFESKINDSAFEQAKNKKNQEYGARVGEKTSVGTEQLVLQKMQELRGR